jgi:23S rRNA (guanine1835-N2)-methyltransferase
MELLSTPRGQLRLLRYPPDPRDQLRAWDSADELLLRHLDESELRPGVGAGNSDGDGETVVVNDRWGAITAALIHRRPVSISDSFLAQAAARANLDGNNLPVQAAALRTVLDPAPQRIDLLIVRVPRSLALLEYELARLAPACHQRTVVVGAGRVSDIHTSTLRVFERVLGPTTTSLAERKSRLIFCTPTAERLSVAEPEPTTLEVDLDGGAASGRRLIQYPGVFSADHLDVGTRLLLQALPVTAGPEQVVDLGCGNGVLGIAAAAANADAHVLFADESELAVASARAGFEHNFGRDRPARYVFGDGLAGADLHGTVDRVLNNPPFHTHQARTDATAWRMFGQARDALRAGGELWVVGNRHLGYHVKLSRIFGGCRVMASNPRFVVLRAVRHGRAGL